MNLLETTNSVEQHVYYQKGENPEKIQQYYLGIKGEGIIGGKTTTMAPKLEPKIDKVKSVYK